MNNKTKSGLLLSALALCGAVSVSAVYANSHAVHSNPAAVSASLDAADGVKAPDSEVLTKKKAAKKK